MADMRRCKECGKLFKPKGREQYCSNEHYRPCPICGTPVLVKYLSDPPRRCANCKTAKVVPKIKPLFDIPDNQSTDIIEQTSKKSITSTSLNETSENQHTENQHTVADLPHNKDLRTFIGKDYRNGKGFLPGHIYEVDISKDEYSYWVRAVFDWTSNKEVQITELFSSIISIDGHFRKLKSAD